jgi:hypothetical protein
MASSHEFLVGFLCELFSNNTFMVYIPNPSRLLMFFVPTFLHLFQAQILLTIIPPANKR